MLLRFSVCCFLALCSLPSAFSQIIEPQKLPLTKSRAQQIATQLITDLDLDRERADSLLGSVAKSLTPQMSAQQTRRELERTFGQYVAGGKEGIDSLIIDTEERSERGPAGGASVTTEGNLKTNLQAYRLVIAAQSLRIPLYINIGPEVPLTNGVESDESKARKLVDLTGGTLGLAAKKYFSITKPTAPDYSVRAHAQLAGNFTTNQDSSNRTSVNGGTVQVGGGLTAEAVISGDRSGFIWLEGSVGYNWLLGESRTKIFPAPPAKNFAAAVFVGRLMVFGLIDIQAHYYKAFSSKIPVLDDGIGMVTLGVSTSLSQ